MYGYIYLTTNLINNKKYIGKHKSNIFEPDKYMGSGKYLNFAFKKYGKENFKCSLLEECFSNKELNDKEIYWISYFNAVDSDDFYNIGIGGEGYSHKNHISIVKDNKQKFIPKDKLNYYLNNGWVKKGLTPTKETINKIKIKTTGKKRSQEFSLKRSLFMKGKLLDETTKEKMSKSHLGKDNCSRKNKIAVYNKDLDKVSYIDKQELNKYLDLGWVKQGKSHSLESKENHSKAQSNRVYIHNQSIIKHVLNTEVNYYLTQGWKLGKIDNLNHSQNSNIFWVYNKEIIDYKLVKTLKELNTYLTKGYELIEVK